MEEFTARFYNGKNSIPQVVRVKTFNKGLCIMGEDNLPQQKWRWRNIYIATAPLSGLQGALGHKKDKAIRLIIPDDAWESCIVPHTDHMRPAISTRAWMMITGAIIAAALFIKTAPQLVDSLVPFVPQDWQVRLGKVVLDDFKNKHKKDECKPSRTVRAAIERLANSFDTGQPPIHVFFVYDFESNARAIPFRNIILLSGLLHQAPSQAALAGVIAHEVGHLHYKHGLRGLLRAQGLKLLEVALTGGTFHLIDMADTLLINKSSRTFESEADAYSLMAMQRGGYDPRGNSTFLKYWKEFEVPFEKPTGDLLENHPDTGARIAVLEKMAAALPPHPTPYKQPFTAAEWRDIQSACLLPKPPKFPLKPSKYPLPLTPSL